MPERVRNIPEFYRNYLRKNSRLLWDHVRSLEVVFRKKMKNLVFGTNRSIFLTTTGKDNEGNEKWMPGKPINRVNIRATVSNFFPENIIDSIYINTYVDERQLVFYLLVDASDAMYPAQLVCGVEDPLSIKAVHSICIQSILLYLAREYDCEVRLVYYPETSPSARQIDIKKQGTSVLADIFDRTPGPSASPASAFDFLIRRGVRHSVVVLISDESAFNHPDRGDLLEKIATFSMTNDVIYFPVCTDFDGLLSKAAGDLEISMDGETHFISSQEDRKQFSTKAVHNRIANFNTLRSHGLSTCPIDCGKSDWAFDVVDFFKNRLVCR